MMAWKKARCEIRWCNKLVRKRGLVRVNENIGDGSWVVYICRSCSRKLNLKTGGDLPNAEVVKSAVEVA